MTPIRPFHPVSPGEILEESLQAKAWSQRDLATILGRPVQAVNEIIGGKKAITPETAIALAEAFGGSADYWLGLEARYRLDLIHGEKATPENRIRRRAKLFSKAPVNELIKRGWIKADLTNLDQTEKALCDFLEIPTIDDDPKAPFSARKTRRQEPHTTAQVAWAYRMRKVARGIKSNKYSKSQLSDLIKQMPSRSRSEAETKGIVSALASVGVRAVFVSHLSGTRIDGGALWLGDIPVVGLSLRYDRIDWFWFTLMHELAHVIEGEESLDLQLVGNDAERSDLEYEERADQAAAEWLVPQQALKLFIRSVKPYFSRSAILDFAEQIRVHPGIIVGQLQKSGHIPYSHHRNLLTRIRHLFSETS